MSKKYILEIPENCLELVHAELILRQGEVSSHWSDALHNFGWLTEVKENLTFGEWDELDRRGESPIMLKEYEDRERAWNAALENNKPESLFDEKLDKKAFSEFCDKNNVVTGRIMEEITTDTVICIWNAALKYARGES